MPVLIKYPMPLSQIPENRLYLTRNYVLYGGISFDREQSNRRTKKENQPARSHEAATRKQKEPEFK